MLNLENLESYTQSFGKTHILPITEDVDKTGRFPKEAYDELRKQGYMGLLVSKGYGGLGGGDKEHAIACYNLAQFDASSALCYMMHNTAVACLEAFGSEELKKEFLPKIAKGEIALALAYSESSSGTHFNLPDIIEEERNGKRILKGRKSFVTSAQNADYYLTYTNSCKVKGGKNNWLVSKDSPNLIHEEGVWDGLGMRGNSSKPVQYNGVELEDKYLVGKEGDGENQAGLVAMIFVTGLGAVYSGLGKAAYDCVLNHCKNRTYTDGKSLADIEMVRIHLAEIYTKVQSSFALVQEAARSFDAKENDFASKIFACRINATYNVMEACTLAMKLGGGKAYSKLLPLERYLRDSLASQVMAPSLDVLKVWLGEAIVK
ncbi:acyl-CoA dehydrogenase family protein [Helicobacter sp. MIT 14-3879]|uniref:acyl-CoA dehydrogenase family protein n=1 Tax=Helicobacter sp. MIT 14-3879 TaxID=2040649 RepID=UPI000E1EF2F9|nr:acyl-CoA dehydrogenase family protein [Helicobacter sp. MIT 14-3879]RDU64169.1 acyl-CoA dehydrogenase [Helicobacter sp. MIT 14-3879]